MANRIYPTDRNLDGKRDETKEFEQKYLHMNDSSLPLRLYFSTYVFGVFFNLRTMKFLVMRFSVRKPIACLSAKSTFWCF